MSETTGGQPGLRFVEIDAHIAEFVDPIDDDPVGENLQRGLRYGPYRPEQVAEDYWRFVFGADVDNYKHMQLTRHQTAWVIRHNERDDLGLPPVVLTEWEQDAARFMATVHDWAEGHSQIGDVHYDEKQLLGGDEEATLLSRYVEDYLRSVDHPQAGELTSLVRRIEEDKEGHLLGRVFNSVEKLGYVRTALIAWRESLVDSPDFALHPVRRSDSDTDLTINCRTLAHNVLANQIPKLLHYAEEFPAVRLALYRNAPEIGQAFTGLAKDNLLWSSLNPFIAKGHSTAAAYARQFAEAKEAWFAEKPHQWLPAATSDA